MQRWASKSVQDRVLHVMGWQVRDPQAGLPGAPGDPGPCSTVAESSASSNAHCLGFCPPLHPNQGTVRPMHSTRRV